MTDRISGSAFKQMITFGAACVTQQKQAINDLNVFPVPDGDTGTNMSLTIQTAVNELKKSEPATVGEAAKITAGALLRGARGNSGVILSLLFRGLSKSVKGLTDMDGAQLAAAMAEGVTTAYGAVMKPAEGTVLTVSRLAAARAVEAAQENPSAEYVLEQAIAAGYETLAQTIDMNPVLKKAGVVDAGGKGYLIILDGMLRALRGEALPQVEEDGEKDQDKADFGALPGGHHLHIRHRVYRPQARRRGHRPLSGLSGQHRRQPGPRRGRRGLQGPCPHRHPGRGSDGGCQVRHPGAGQDRKHAHPGGGAGSRQEGPEHRRPGRH